MTPIIGIKIANGEFYPIFEENSSVKKRMILTTVHDNQLSVQIDLYRSTTQTMTEAQYIGSLVIDKIKPKPRGEPSIEMVISSNANGDIIADAIDLDSTPGGEHQILSVSLKSLDEASRDIDLPDFELENNVEPPTGLYKQTEKIKEKDSRSFPSLIVLLIGLVIILALAALWFFLYGGKEKVSSMIGKPTTEQPPVETDQTLQEPAQQPEPPPVIQAPVSPPPVREEPPVRTRPAPPVASYRVPATIPREGVPYTIRWGDTLWDISEAFYRNPWLYPRIARFNNIRNPDLIISGRTIRVPPRN
ncbi:MAG: Hsp70 family protein [Treponema sp.]|nr:Hsp70 family protein [Treponema sp.]